MFQVGDNVWLFQHNVKTTRPCDKLDCQHHSSLLISGSPFPCVSIECFMYHFWNLMLQDLFHIVLSPPLPHPLLVQLVDELEHEVEVTLDSKVVCNKIYYMMD